MIRREISHAGCPRQWLLVSQVEHARLSGLLAENGLSQLDAAVRSDLQQAIGHHDDGWADWDAAMPIDQEHHRPWAFHELPLELSLPIWTASIDAAAEIGPLAGCIVAGHFLALLDASEKSAPNAEAWQREMSARREAWFAEWQNFDPERHTSSLAEEALHWLQLFDVLSLWLCNVCPGQGEPTDKCPTSYRLFADKPLETEFSYQQGKVRVSPWRFDVSSLQLEAVGWVVPVREYINAEALFAAREQCSVRWELHDSH